MLLAPPALPPPGGRGHLFVVVGFGVVSAAANEAAEIITEGADTDAQILFGAVVDPQLGDGVQVTVIATGFNAVPDSERLPATTARPKIEREPEETTPARTSRFLVPGGPNSEYGINQSDDYEIPAILRKQMD